MAGPGSYTLHPMALQTTRAYRTVSRSAALALAGFPPLVHVAAEYAGTYTAIREAQDKGSEITRAGRFRLRLHFHKKTLENWQQDLSRESAGRQVIDAIQPILGGRVNRDHGGLTYRVTQMLSGHGCFGKYPYRIGKKGTAACHHCDNRVDTAQHTMEECPAWADERRTLRDIVGEDLCPPTLVAKMVESEEAWCGIITFCEAVMRAKRRWSENVGAFPLREMCARNIGTGSTVGGGVRGFFLFSPPPHRVDFLEEVDRRAWVRSVRSDQ